MQNAQVLGHKKSTDMRTMSSTVISGRCFESRTCSTLFVCSATILVGAKEPFCAQRHAAALAAEISHDVACACCYLCYYYYYSSSSTTDSLSSGHFPHAVKVVAEVIGDLF
jgi:hypothetical protein